MPRYKLTLAYDGSDFHGWQRQEPPLHAHALARIPVSDDPAFENVEFTDETGATRRKLRTVQEVLLRAVQEVVREPVVIHGASRTDSGVHARGQVAAFSTNELERGRGWPADRGVLPLMRAINSRLPEDVLITKVEIVPDSFNPITDCVSKGYSYSIHASPHRSLWDRPYTHHAWTRLDVPAMQAAAALLAGEHDFAAFAAAGHGRTSTVRTIFSCTVTEEPPPFPLDPTERRVRIDISGNGFLWNMVRIIAGTLLEVGRGKFDPFVVTKAIASKDRRDAGPTLPATGLCLEWIRYRDEATVCGVADGGGGVPA